MYLKFLSVKNLRALEDIQVEFSRGVNVIVGPNASGKTTVLEAIRLARALLVPRTNNEPTQVLQGLGAIAMYNQGALVPEALARNPRLPVEIRCRYELSVNELGLIEAGLSAIATEVMRAQMGQSFNNPAMFMPFLSSEAGRNALAQSLDNVKKKLDEIKGMDRNCSLDLTLGPSNSDVRGADLLAQACIAFLERIHPPHITGFSYFPADRALPSGEPPVQLGAADAAQQIESHNSQPQTKYGRLKNTIFAAVVQGENDRKKLESDFAAIFNGILKGRKLVSVGTTPQGLLSIKVQDTETNRIFQVDSMSSGEKGILLVFLLIARSVSDDGIILLDEPELHLNPAVCKHLLSFLVENYVKPKRMQAIICSHSPEILAGAFESEECTLYHLVNEKLLTKVRRQDQEVISAALKRLGASEHEGLLYKGIIFVEGTGDSEVLEIGFGDLLRRYKLKDLGGRREVERYIQSLQEAEGNEPSAGPTCFIFDRDSAPTTFVNSSRVRLLQWRSRCLENYLIDLDILTDLLKDPQNVKQTVSNHAEVSVILQELAMSQLDNFVAREIYEKMKFDNPGLRTHEVKDKSIPEIADVLFKRLASLRDQLLPLSESDWKQNFTAQCLERRQRLEQVWQVKWQEECDGKQLFKDLHPKVGIKYSIERFKSRVMQAMRDQKSTKWRLLESHLKELIEPPQEDLALTSGKA